MNRKPRVFGLAVAAVLALPALGVAQAPPSTTPPVLPKAEAGKPDPCAQSRATIGQGADIAIEKPEGKTLSDQLAQSDGVICPPPRVDEEMTQQPPPGGKTPVIPPSAVTPETRPK
jgi:hypothetical protein